MMVIIGMDVTNVLIILLHRWKGENVSTTEVSEVLGVLDFIQEANVYGVTVQGLWSFSHMKVLL